MKFNFKIQQYQTDAVDSVVQVFNGQVQHEYVYRHDVGRQKENDQGMIEGLLDLGYGNEAIQLGDELLLSNIHKVQDYYNVQRSEKLIKDLGRCELDINMETGTGKTYVYIKTMFELHKRYGWSKFIVVVPSIAIREGVRKSFEMLEEHFMEHYGGHAQFFVYNSKNLNQLDDFATSSGINVMIINMQAFNASLNEDKNVDGRKGDAAARIIYNEHESFGYRRPIDVIAAMRPIIIKDEPQKMGGPATQRALQKFNPLFSINYSATHTQTHNLVYVLDSLDEYIQKLVKRIEVKGVKVKNLRGTEAYLYLENIIVQPNKKPMARLEFNVKHNSGIKPELRIVAVGDRLYDLSNEILAYRDGFEITDINPKNNTITFTNGLVLEAGESNNDITEDYKRRIQIRGTIYTHFEKEEKLFRQGIKTLSLFFIDEVAKYRQYDEDGNKVLGEYGVIFEEEYKKILEEQIKLHAGTEYGFYLKRLAESEYPAHEGYFSIDKKTKREVDSKVKGNDKTSDDESAYDLILKNKEQLLSFEEPTRFIFSHSALREGWDNPNVFQICTLKQTGNETTKRQEVGRGMRLCVNQEGNRMDAAVCGDGVHNINLLTVFTSESYDDFVRKLQEDDKDGMKKGIYQRPMIVDIAAFENKKCTIDGEEYTIDKSQAKLIYKYLINNGYLTDDDKVTDKYKTDAENRCLVELPESIKILTPFVHRITQSAYDEVARRSLLETMITDGREAKVERNGLNQNFYKPQFQELWKRINHKYAYTVSFDSEELVRNSIRSITNNLEVTKVICVIDTGKQKEVLEAKDVESGTSFAKEKTSRNVIDDMQPVQIKYDLVGEVAKRARITRKSTVKILNGIPDKKLKLFKENPEEFINKVSKLINEQKAALIVEHVTYNQIEGEYEASIFTEEKSRESFAKAFKADKHIQDYVFTDGYAEKSVERCFAEALDAAEEVCVYAKLPRAFKIPTPVGNYSPDWAIAFEKEKVKHIYFVAETKGSLESLQLKPIEQAKIKCAKKLFDELSGKQVRYDVVDDYDKLYNLVAGVSEPVSKVINYDNVALPEVKMVAEEREKY